MEKPVFARHNSGIFLAEVSLKYPRRLRTNRFTCDLEVGGPNAIILERGAENEDEDETVALFN